jgi:hypothetical protein
VGGIWHLDCKIRGVGRWDQVAHDGTLGSPVALRVCRRLPLLGAAVPSVALYVIEINQVLTRTYRVSFNGHLRIVGSALGLVVLLGGIVSCWVLGRRAYVRSRLGGAVATAFAILAITLISGMVTEALLYGVAVI